MRIKSHANHALTHEAKEPSLVSVLCHKFVIVQTSYKGILTAILFRLSLSGAGGGGELLLFEFLAMRHSGARQPRVRSGKQMVAEGKANNSVSNGIYRWQLSVMAVIVISTQIQINTYNFVCQLLHCSAICHAMLCP